MANIDKFGRIKTHRKTGERITESRLVWENNYRKIPDNHIIHHIDNNPSNNNLKNLKLVSYRQHGKEHSLQIDVEQLKKDYNLGMSCREIAEKYSCSMRTIRRRFREESFKLRNFSETNKIWHSKKKEVV